MTPNELPLIAVSPAAERNLGIPAESRGTSPFDSACRETNTGSPSWRNWTVPGLRRSPSCSPKSMDSSPEPYPCRTARSSQTRFARRPTWLTSCACGRPSSAASARSRVPAVCGHGSAALPPPGARAIAAVRLSPVGVEPLRKRSRLSPKRTRPAPAPDGAGVARTSGKLQRGLIYRLLMAVRSGVGAAVWDGRSCSLSWTRVGSSAEWMPRPSPTAIRRRRGCRGRRRAPGHLRHPNPTAFGDGLARRDYDRPEGTVRPGGRGGGSRGAPRGLGSVLRRGAEAARAAGRARCRRARR